MPLTYKVLFASISTFETHPARDTRHGHASCPWHRCVLGVSWPLTSPFDLAVHPVNLSEHVFRPSLHLQVGQLAVRMVLNAEFVLDGIEHL